MTNKADEKTETMGSAKASLRWSRQCDGTVRLGRDPLRKGKAGRSGARHSKGEVY